MLRKKGVSRLTAILLFLLISSFTSNAYSITKVSSLTNFTETILNDWPPPTKGDWIINDVVFVSGETFEMNGRIIIIDGGHLYLKDCELTMNSHTNYYPLEQGAYIHVQQGSYLTIRETTIKSGTNYSWYIKGDGDCGIDIQDSSLEGVFPRENELEPAFRTKVYCGGWPEYIPCKYAIIKSTTIKHCKGDGIFVQAEKTEIIGNDISNVYGSGIIVYNCSNGVITENKISNVGLEPYRGKEQIGIGIKLMDCRNTKVSSNMINNVNTKGFDWVVSTFGSYPICEVSLSEFEDNVVDGKPVLYLQSEDSVTVANHWTEVILNNCSDITVRDIIGNSISVTYSPSTIIENCTITGGGITIAYSNFSIITNNTVTNSIYFDSMIGVYHSNNTVITENILRNHLLYCGIFVRWLDHAYVSGNRINCMAQNGIVAMDCTNVNITENTVSETAWEAIRIWRASGILVRRNQIHRTTGTTYNYFRNEIYPGYAGITLECTTESIIDENDINKPLSEGLYVKCSPDVIVTNNVIMNTPGRGMIFDCCNSPNIISNSITNASWMGVGFVTCDDVVITDTKLEQIHGRGFYWCSTFEGRRFAKFDRNTMDNKPWLLYQDDEFISVSKDIAGVILLNCSNTIVENLSVSGIFLADCLHCIIQNCDLEGGGISLSFSHNTTVSCCAIRDTPYYNWTMETQYSRFSISWGLCGIDIFHCLDSLIIANSIDNIGLDGIYNYCSFPMNIIGNSITNVQEYGIYLDSAREIIITANTINNTHKALVGFESSRNIALHFNSFGNADGDLVYIEDSRWLVWDNGSYGNFWSDYAGEDNNSDGIGDTPYIIDARHADRYPLMSSSSVDTQRETLFSIGPSVLGVQIHPENPLQDENITIIADLYTPNRIAHAILSYSTDNGATWVNVTMVLNEEKWIAILPSLPAGLVKCKLYVQDCLGNWVVYEIKSFGIEATLNIPLIAATGLIIGLGVIALVVVLKRRM